MTGRPLYAEPIEAWRVWRVSLDARLRPLTRATKPWPARERVVARCLVAPDHVAPAAACSCGVWAVPTRERALEIASMTVRTPVAVGRVALWGRVVEHEGGWRAQYAYPIAVTVYDDGYIGAGERARSARRLASEYAIEADSCARPEHWQPQIAVQITASLLQAQRAYAEALQGLAEAGKRINAVLKTSGWSA